MAQLRRQSIDSFDNSAQTFNRGLWMAVIILEIFIGFRIFLKAIGANPDAGFADFVYSLTGPFLAPFTELISNPSASQSILEITSIIAIAVYFILFLLASTIMRVFWYR